MTSEFYKIAFVPLNAFGHVNACLGMATNMRQRDHKCVFIANQNWKDLIEKHGFEYHLDVEGNKVEEEKSWNEFMDEQCQFMGLSSFDKIRRFNISAFSSAIKDTQLLNEKLKKILNDVKPDAIVVDSDVAIPAVMTAGVPWIDLCSCNPLYYLDDERLPPGESGYPMNGDKKLWKTFKDELIGVYRDELNSFNSWVQSEGAVPLESNAKFTAISPYLNMYLYPKELSYFDTTVPQHTKRFFIDALIREESEPHKFVIPDQLNGRPGKLFYFSMGTLSCSDLKLMKRLVSILTKSKHRFIVSKGPLGDQLELADNMWGQNYLPQLQVLPLVDLVITHGGNNTVTESLHCVSIAWTHPV